MAAIKLVIDGEAYDFEQNRLMLSEAIALEEHWNMSPEALDKALASGSPSFRFIGALAWLVKLRALAAEKGIRVDQAAAELPPAAFDVNLGAMRIEQVEEPENPTGPAIRSPATRTSRTTSAAKRAKRS